MLNGKLVINNKLGLHARAAVKLVQLASRYDSQVTLVRGNREVSGKSIMGVMMLAAAKGAELELIIDGPDEEEAFAQMILLVEGRFGEHE